MKEAVGVDNIGTRRYMNTFFPNFFFRVYLVDGAYAAQLPSVLITLKFRCLCSPITHIFLTTF